VHFPYPGVKCEPYKGLREMMITDAPLVARITDTPPVIVTCWSRGRLLDQLDADESIRIPMKWQWKERSVKYLLSSADILGYIGP
jgi:hypothetical protein